MGIKESKTIKRKSKIIRDSEVLLKAGSNSTASFFRFTLRDNCFFTIDEGVMFWWDYYAGTWIMKNDTIYLHFINEHKRVGLLNYIYIDSIDNKLVIPTIDSTRTLKVDIYYNKLEKQKDMYYKIE